MTATSSPLQPLGTQEVADLHARFLVRVEKKAADLLAACEIESTPPAAQAAVHIVMHALHLRAEEMLFAGRVKPALMAAATGHADAQKLLDACLEKLTAHVEQRERERSRFGSAGLSEKMTKKFNRAAARRETPPEIATLFGDNERLYFPLTANAEMSDSQRRVADLLAQQPQAYRIIDWAKGRATDAKGKQEFKIGKLLAGLDEKLYKDFQECPTRLAGRLLAVISRNPQDIARGSVNRAWYNCAGAGGFDNDAFKKMGSGIQGGMLVAYLISESDPDILNPLGRVMIKPFDRWWIGDKRGLSNIANDLFNKEAAPARRLYLADKPYGLNSEAFAGTVNQILRERLNTGTFDIYKLNAKRFYDDAVSEATVHGDGRIETIGWRYRFGVYDRQDIYNVIPAPTN